MSIQPQQVRSLYRRLLRELPARIPSILANPSLLQKHIRSDISTSSRNSSNITSTDLPAHQRFEQAEQYVSYLRAQRMYTTLLERYNPGMNMSEEERVRLTARRVGMDLPIEMMNGESDGNKQ